MPRMTKEQIKSAVCEQIADSEGYETDELADLRKNALDCYYNRPGYAPSSAGRSSLQSSDVADMIEAVVSQVMPSFEIDNVVEFEPLSEEDVDQARNETAAVNHIVMEKNNGFYEIQQAVRDALLLRNGLIKVYLDEKVDITTEVYENLTELEYGQLNMGAVEDIGAVDNGYTVTLDDEDRGFFDVTVKNKSTNRQIKTKAVDPSQFSWERDHDSIYLQDIRFCAERSLPTRSELIEMGYPRSIVNKLNAGGTDTHVDSLARNQNSARKTWQGSTPATDIIEFFECYIRLDVSGNGIAELMKVCIANDTLLDHRPADFVPYASGTPFLQPHRFNGLGMYDKLRHIQDQKTFGIRQWADNVNNANNLRVSVVDGQVNVDDVVNSRPGGVVRIRAPGSIEPFPFTDVGPSIQGFLEYGDKIRSERGGASLDLQAAELQVAGQTAHGVERQMSSREQLAAMITRTLAETLLRTTYKLVHTALRLYVTDPFQFRVSGQFQQADPSQWQEREEVHVKAGLSMAERMRKSASLQGVVAQQQALLQAGEGGTMVDSASMYTALLDLARADGLSAPEQYYVDPASQEAQQAAQGKQQQAQQEQQYQQQLLELQKQIEQRKADNEDAKVMEDSRQHDQELQFKYWEAGQKQELEEAKTATDIALKMVSNGNENSGGASATGESTTSAAG